MFEKLFQKKALVYNSKDEADWQNAQTLLTSAAIRFKAWHSEELPVGGCGSKIDVRKLGAKGPIPKELYKIEVNAGEKEKAEAVLAGAVKAIRYL